MSFSETEMDVIRWSEARCIIQNSDAKTQLLKGVSEMGELADAVLKGDRDATRDGVGDVLVCLINVCAILDLDLTDCLKAAYKEIRHRRGHLTKSGVFIKEAP